MKLNPGCSGSSGASRRGAIHLVVDNGFGGEAPWLTRVILCDGSNKDFAEVELSINLGMPKSLIFSWWLIARNFY